MVSLAAHAEPPARWQLGKKQAQSPSGPVAALPSRKGLREAVHSVFGVPGRTGLLTIRTPDEQSSSESRPKEAVPLSGPNSGARRVRRARTHRLCGSRLGLSYT